MKIQGECDDGSTGGTAYCDVGTDAADCSSSPSGCEAYDDTDCETCNSDGDASSLAGCYWCTTDNKCHTHGSVYGLTCTESLETSQCPTGGGFTEIGPAEFLYQATICLFESAYGVVSNLVQLIRILATLSSGQIDSACESIVNSLESSATEAANCDPSSLCVAMGPSEPACDIVFLALCVTSTDVGNPCQCTRSHAPLCVVAECSSPCPAPVERLCRDA